MGLRIGPTGGLSIRRLHATPDGKGKGKRSTDHRADKLQGEPLMLNVGLINADLNCDRVKHVQYNTTGCLCALLTTTQHHSDIVISYANTYFYHLTLFQVQFKQSSKVT